MTSTVPNIKHLYATGDTHCEIDMGKLSTGNFPEQGFMDKSTAVFILGDFGCIWKRKDPTSHWWLKWLRDKPWTTLFIDGNHENFELLFEMESYEGMLGPKSTISPVVLDNTLYPNIYYVHRGSILEIKDKTIFCMGGGDSIDKERRTIGVTWWKEEIPNYSEIDRALGNLEFYDNKVNYVFTHAIYEEAFRQLAMGINTYKHQDKMHPILQGIRDQIEFDHWYCGHYHVDKTIENLNTSFLYKEKPTKII